MGNRTLNPIETRKLDQAQNGELRHKSPNIKNMVAVNVSPKTTIYFKSGKDLDKKVANWKENHKNCVY